MGHSAIDHLQELLFGLRVIVQHPVRNVYDLNQVI
jgi:hypothetical protein